jgi:tetratricopeptide (TPR) repeat protein
MRRGVIKVVVVLLLTARAVHAQPRAIDDVERGWQALQRRDGDTAAPIFRAALQTRPRDPGLHFGAGLAEHLRGRDEEAVKALKEALRLSPRLTQASGLLGEIYYGTGELDAAIKTYEVALSYAPDDMILEARLEQWKREASVHAGFEAIKDDRFAIMFSGPVEERLAERAARVLGSAFWQIGGGLGSYPANPIKIILYTDKQFRDITGAPEWAGGGFDGQIRLPVRGAAENLPQFDRVLIHELTHAMLHAVASRNVPAWLNEGLAMYFDGKDARLSERRLAARHVYVPLQLLQSSFSRLNAAQATFAYEQSAVAARVLVDRIGLAGVGMLLQDLDSGQTVEEAIVRHGFTLTEFEADLVRRAAIRP